MLGKSKCRILKEIRQKIADENDIPYVTRECSFQGDCSGTCPRCESELRYLERELAMRQRLGKTVAVAAICAGIALTVAGCNDRGKPIETDLAGVMQPDHELIEQEPNKGRGTPSGKDGGAFRETGNGLEKVVPDHGENDRGDEPPEPLEGEAVELSGDVEVLMGEIADEGICSPDDPDESSLNGSDDHEQ